MSAIHVDDNINGASTAVLKRSRLISVIKLIQNEILSEFELTSKKALDKCVLTRKNTDTREKIQQGWKEKGAPFRSGGAKRRIQGVSKRKKVVAQKDGYKVPTAVVLRRNGGVF